MENKENENIIISQSNWDLIMQNLINDEKTSPYNGTKFKRII